MHRVTEAIRHGNCLHYSRNAGDVDLPHAIEIKPACIVEIRNIRQVDDRTCIRLADQVCQAPAGWLFAQVHADKTFQFPLDWGPEIDTDNAISFKVG
jgi:hypothetical protein